MDDVRSQRCLDRRGFLSLAATALASGLAVPTAPGQQDADAPQVTTVRGPIRADEMGKTLAHEHVVVDFIGAAKATPERYDHEAAFAAALPHLRALKGHGVSTLVECTPAYIGRNPSLLVRLSKGAGLHIVTNTGWYAAVEHKYLPPEAHTETAEQIAKRWLGECADGIGQSGVKPGFLKLGTDKGPLANVDAKLLRAAAAVHHETGLTIAVHTGDGKAAIDELRILREQRIDPQALIWVHAQNDPGAIQVEAAKQGAWVSLDGYSRNAVNLSRYPTMVEKHRDAGTLSRVLISHDDGWAVDGDKPTGNPLKLFGNGNPEPYRSIFTHLIPELRRRGFTDADVDQILKRNPAEALAIRRRVI